MPKVTLHISLKNISPILKGIKLYNLGVTKNPWVEGSFEGNLFQDGYNAARFRDPITIQDEWGDEIEIFNGNDIIDENIKKIKKIKNDT